MGNDEEAEGRADDLPLRPVNHAWTVAPRVDGVDFMRTAAHDPTRDVVLAWDFGPDDQAGVPALPSDRLVRVALGP